jgi:hypothetical protein
MLTSEEKYGYPPQVTHAFPSAAPQQRPFFVFWNQWHAELCRTLLAVFNQYVHVTS